MVRKIVFEYWTDLASKADAEDITQRNFVSEALTWTGEETKSDWRDKQSILYDWFDMWYDSYNKTRVKTNEDFVTGLMRDNNRLMQVFVIECLGKWSSYLVQNEEEVLEIKDSFVNMEAWLHCAKTVLKEKEEFYKNTFK